MSTILPSSPRCAPGDNRNDARVHLRVAVVRMRAQCRTAASTIAELRGAVSSAAPGPSVSRGVLLNRVNHDLAALARTSAEVEALRALASPAMSRDIDAIGRNRESLERPLDDVAALAGDLRKVRRSESIAVVGPDGSSMRVVALGAALESTTAVFRVADPHAAMPKRASPARRSRTIRRFTLRDLATAFLLRRLAARGA